MTFLLGHGLGNGAVYSIFGNGAVGFAARDPTSFTLVGSDGSALVAAGPGFTYIDLGNGYYSIAGTITGVGYAKGGSSQGWAGLNVDSTAVLASLAAHDENGFDNLFFGGDDTFVWNDVPGSSSAPSLYGFGGNDVFNIADWDANGGGRYHIDGGSGNDTLNISGGIGAGNYTSTTSISGNISNFNVTGVETIKLAAGSSYKILAPSTLTTGSSTVTVDGSALGPGDFLDFSTNVSNITAPNGNLVLLGGAGNDFFQGGTGNTIFNGGGGINGVDFLWAQQASHASGVTADLSITGSQSFGPGWGTGTFINIQSLAGSRWNDTLTGNAADNVIYGAAGNDTLNGGQGFDVALFDAPLSSYTITRSGSTVTIVGPDGTDTLTSVEWGSFSDQIVRIAGPVMTTHGTRLAAGQSVALSSLFSVNDLNGAAITQYQLWDGTGDPNSGYFTLNGTPLAARTLQTVTAASLSQYSYVAGTVIDALQIRAFDGTSWSASDNGSWAPFQAGPGLNNLPVLTTANKSASRSQTFALSSLFTVTDADSDTITKYQLWDGNRDPASGYFTINNVVQAGGTVIEITAAQLAQTNFVTGKLSDTLQIRAYDGLGWSAADNASWAPFTVSVPADVRPVLATNNVTSAPGQSLALSSLVTYSDADGDPATAYQLWDSSSDPASGHWVVNNVAQSAGTLIQVSAAQAAQTYFLTGSVSDRLQVRASDGVLWSADDNAPWSAFTVAPPVNRAPVVTANDAFFATAGQSVALSTLFNVSDADGDTITKYQLWNSSRDPNAAYFTLNGVKQNGGTLVDISAAQLAQTSVVTGSVSTRLQIRAFDGKAWSAADDAAWSPFYILAPVNNAPVLTGVDRYLNAGQSLPFTSLFSLFDQDGDTMTRYQFWDGTSDPNSGHLVINGVVQPARTLIEIMAADIPQTTFVGGSVPTALQVRAFDGKAWSAADNAAWSPFTVSTPPPPVNHAPVLTTTNLSAPPGLSKTLSSLSTVTDSDSDPITKYQLWDATSDPNSGHFVVNGVDKLARTVIEVTSAQFAQTFFVTGSVSDSIQIRAFDGQAWSAADNASWAPFTITPTVNHPPVVSHTFVADDVIPVFHLRTVPLANLFTARDDDGDAITRYQLWDGTADPNSGHFVVNGVVQSARTVIDITAADFDHTSFVTGLANDALQIRAMAGGQWSAADNASWAPTVISVIPNSAPVLTTSDISATPNQSRTLASLFSVTDGDGDTMTRYQLRDDTNDPDSGRWLVNNVVQAAGTVIDITAAQLSQTVFIAGTVGDTLQIRAFDGIAWSAADNASWAPFHVTV